MEKIKIKIKGKGLPLTHESEVIFLRKKKSQWLYSLRWCFSLMEEILSKKKIWLLDENKTPISLVLYIHSNNLMDLMNFWKRKWHDYLYSIIILFWFSSIIYLICLSSNNSNDSNCQSNDNNLLNLKFNGKEK